MYDASYEEIQVLQEMLARNGISKKQLDLDQYAGLTYTELKGIVNNAIEKKNRSENNG